MENQVQTGLDEIVELNSLGDYPNSQNEQKTVSDQKPPSSLTEMVPKTSEAPSDLPSSRPPVAILSSNIVYPPKELCTEFVVCFNFSIIYLILISYLVFRFFSQAYPHPVPNRASKLKSNWLLNWQSHFPSHQHIPQHM